MKKTLSYILSPIYYIIFAFLLLIFHPIQVICRKVWGCNAHKKSVELLNLLLFTNLRIMGTKIHKKKFYDLPVDRPLIIIANHQNSFDIPPIIWFFRKYHPIFISKIKLAKNIPSISYHLRHSGAALIDRKNLSQATIEINKLGQLIEKNNYSACIFPEGTRSKDGKMRKFKTGGIKILLKASPSALIVPFAIQGGVNLYKYGLFPLSFGETLSYTLLGPIEPKGLSFEDIISKTEDLISNELEQLGQAN